MNNKGFTLLEVLAVLVIISLITIFVLNQISSTFSVSKEETYKIMKNNIVSASYDYIKECTAGLIDCNFSFEHNNRFTARVLKENGYFKTMESPIDNKELGDCLILEATKDNGVILVDLIDTCY